MCVSIEFACVSACLCDLNWPNVRFNNRKTTSTTRRPCGLSLPGWRNPIKFGKVKAETIFPLCEKWYRFHYLQPHKPHTHTYSRSQTCVCMWKNLLVLIAFEVVTSASLCPLCAYFPLFLCIPLFVFPSLPTRNPFSSGSHASASTWVIYRKSVFGKTSFSVAIGPEVQFNVALH